jgi:hypothetical protein
VSAKRLLALAVATLAAASCARSADRADDLRVVPLSGDVHLLEGGEPVSLTEETAVDPGDVVRTGPSGRALVEVGLAGRIEVGGQSEIVVEHRPEVLRGSVLASATSDGMALRAGDAEIEASEAVFRVDSGFSVTVAVYRGAATILGSGIGDLLALRQAVVVAGGFVPRGPRPLVVRPDDPWDIRLLGAAIDLGLDLVRLERGLSRTLPPRDQEAAVVRALAGSIPRPVLIEVLRRVEAAETVVAAQVSRAAADASGVSVAQILSEVLGLRGQGAHWIVVAAEWRLPADPVLAELERLAGFLGRLVAPAAQESLNERPGGGGGGGAGEAGGGSGGGITTSSGSGTSTGTDAGGTTGGTVGTGTEETTSGGGSGSGGGGSDGGGSGGGGGGGTPGGGCGIDVQCVVDDLVETIETPPLPGGGGGGGVLP